jgi:dihydroorotate dehydrogenase
VIYQRLLRPLLFRLDPDPAHRAAITTLTHGHRVLRTPAAARDPRLRQELLGLEFPNPVGLAAGFDKLGTAVAAWPKVGFGFAEIGSVTAYPQPGNPPPRMFRLPADEALINRMGFNNDGSSRTAGRLLLAQRRGRLGKIPLGVNIGKSKVTPVEDAAGDYVASLEALWPVADYVVVNVSSPNTPGLRDLQESSALAEIVRALHQVNVRRAELEQKPARPILVKIAPDLTDAQVDAVVDLALELGIAGVVVSNTTLSREGLRTGPAITSEAGGLSGRPLAAKSTEHVRRVARRGGRDLVVVGVGGIFSAEDAWQKVTAGASLVQLYTGLVYEGPGLVARICEGLVTRLQRTGMASIADAVGAEN